MRLSHFVALAAATSVAACQQPDQDWANKAALQAGAPLENAAALREAQTARFPETSEQRLLVEATQVLQDLGFTIEESAPGYGVLAGSKDRDATEAGQVVGQVALTVGLALLGVRYNPVYDTDQVIRATLTTQPLGTRDSQLRVSFERIVTTNQGLSRVERLTEAEFSSGFFERVRAGLARAA
ncbi:hypothetical protein [Teichococcus aestuarii]|uniref:Uncharacterized protein n=1 Tax=Teichococcus aestuarii TaxID=568898 RepID=A0A2U1UZK9_9PROT|nr:hypothetical protein [Pseudoroseomonas aestuarii]PWC27098.1 hypothetical protein CR165_19255 [Pseudoroseomonas aestuarii]